MSQSLNCARKLFGFSGAQSESVEANDNKKAYFPIIFSVDTCSVIKKCYTKTVDLLVNDSLLINLD